MKINEVNSNYIFLFPIVMSLVSKEKIYLTLSISIFIASFMYHLLRKRDKKSTLARYAQYADRGVAVIAYLYMFFFIRNYSLLLQSIIYFLLIMTLLTYFYGKQKDEDEIHTAFHIFIGIVSGLILLFK